MIITDSNFWLGAFILYLIDNIKLINNSELLIKEKMNYKLDGELSSIAFELRGKQIVLLNPFTPFLCVYRMQWLKFDNTSARFLRLDRKKILTLQKKTLIVRYIVIAYFILLFVVGPLINYWVNINIAILVTLVVHTLLLLLFIYVAKKNNFFSEHRKILFICLECALCPMYAPMLLRRITWNTEMFSDGCYFVNKYCLITSRNDVNLVMKNRGEELLDSEIDVNQKEKILSYIEAL